MKMKPHMVIAVLAPICGSSIPMGFNMGVLNMPQKFIRQWIQHCLLEQYNKVLTDNEEVILWTSVVSTFLVGAMIGALNCSSIADKIGRKKTFLLNHILCFIASTLFTVSAYVNYIEVFVIGRFLSGLCGGIASSLVPIYFSEMFPTQLKGVSGVIHVSGMSFGILLSLIAGMNVIIGSESYWPLLSVITIVGSAGALLVHPFITETPSYSFLKIHSEEKTYNALQKLRSNKNDIEVELSHLKELKAKNNSKSTDEDNWDLKRVLKTPKINILLLNVVILFGSQQLSGINGSWFYSSMIFALAGLKPMHSNLATILASTANWIMGSVSFLIARKFPRRVLLLTSITGCVLGLASESISLYFSQEHILIPYISMVSFLIFILSFCLGLGPLPYIMAVELMPEGPRSVALSLGTSVMWSCNLIVSIAFPLLNYYLGSFSLLVFMSFLICSGIYIFIFLPETFNTKQHTLENSKIKNNSIIVISSNEFEGKNEKKENLNDKSKQTQNV
ncbi:unnamed protein product, partial [Meganyctiphanes norvegica]